MTITELPAQRGVDDNERSHHHELRLEFCGPNGETGSEDKGAFGPNTCVRFVCPCGETGTPRSPTVVGGPYQDSVGVHAEEYREHVLRDLQRA